MNNNNYIPPSELILNPDGSVYHLNLLPGQISQDIITVGDPDRVENVARHLDDIEFTISKREFKTITGSKNGKRLTIISTGIGTDNIDIVFTELDALANVDFKSRTKKENHTPLRFYRLGTSGALRADIEVDSIIVSKMAVGLDGLMHYYKYPISEDDKALESKVKAGLENLDKVFPYVSHVGNDVYQDYASLGRDGITITATGFYAPQGRAVIAVPKSSNFLDNMASITHTGVPITNLEMETAGIYGMANLLGHQAISFNAILANRIHQTFSLNPKKTVDELIEQMIAKFVTI